MFVGGAAIRRVLRELRTSTVTTREKAMLDQRDYPTRTEL